MTRSRAILSPILFSFVLLALAAVPARAQYVYGITALQLDPDYGQVYGYSATALDYYACYYYDAAVVGTLYDGSTAIDGGSYHGVCTAEVYTDGFLQDDHLYTEISEHYIIAYYYYYYYGWYDPYGFFSFGPGTYEGGFNYYGCYCPAYFAQSTEDLGSTRVSLFNQGPCNKTPTLNGPNSVNRGSSANFTIGNLCNTARVHDWSFSDGANTVNRGASTATSWSGTMVTSGTVQVTVEQGGRTHSLSKSITVNARNNFAFTAVTPTQVTNGFNCQENGTLSLPTPPSNGSALGKTCLIQRANWNDATISDNGPNNNYKYVTAAFNSDSNQAHPSTAVYYVIHPDLENSNSAFFQAQCGNYNPATNSGFISGSQLLSNTRGHEVGSIRGHYKQYVDTQNKPENNIGVGMEAIVGSPSTSLTDFRQSIVAEASRRRNIIETAFAVEDCNGQVNKDEQCVYRGDINYQPYAACPPQRPANLAASAASQTLVNLSWTDSSSDESGFKIQRSTSGGGFAEIASVGAGVTSYSDTSVAAGTTYTYQVIAWNTTGSSAPSPQATVTTPAAGSPPNAPCCIWGQSNGTGSVTLWWGDQSNNEDDFSIERNDGWGFYAIGWASPNQTSTTDYGLQQGQSYVYRVVAENAFGQSYSEEFYYYSPYWWEQ